MNWFFFKIMWRNLVKRDVFPIINIAGLTIGLSVVALICAFIFNEFSFDKSFTQHQRIYRSINYMTTVMSGQTMGVSSNAFAPAAKEEIPEVEAAVRILMWSVVVKSDDVIFSVEKFCWADEDFFRLFNTPFIYGSPEEAFSRPNTIVISESQAKIFFGDKNPIGETLSVNNQQEMDVSAVFKDFPTNSTFEGYQMFGHYKSSYESYLNEPNWGGFMCETFFLLHHGADIAAVESKMQQVIEKGTEGNFYNVKLQPLGKIHLFSKDITFSNLAGSNGDIGRVKMFSLLAAIVLLVACINYMNLSTARAQKRSKEIGISKTLGEKRKEIIMRLYSETGMLTLLSFVSAFVLAWFLLPVFNLILGQSIQPTIFINSKFLLGMLVIYLVTTFLAASYPALYLSSFAPLTIIRRSVFTKGSSHSFVRKGLSVVQFSVATILIAWVIIIQLQMNFAKNKDIGYNAQNVVGISIPNFNSNPSGFEALKNDYSAQGSVSRVAFSRDFPLGSGGSAGTLFKSLIEMEESQKNNTMPSNVGFIWGNQVTSEIIDMLQLKLIAGTTLPERKPDDSIVNTVVNRKTVEYLGTTPEEIIGKRLPTYLTGNMYVCGVVEDFHFQSLHEPIAPFAFHNSNFNNYRFMLLEVKSGDMTQQLRTYEEIFKKHFPNNVFEVTFPSSIVEKAYETDRQTGSLVMSFSVLAILVACMGVFGLTAFMAEQRTKEIGIRKVLGASVSSIIRLFTDNYLKLLAISLVFALPIAWWIGVKYLENFAYRITLSWWMFAAAALITVILTLLTACFQAYKAATANPVKAIKSE